MGEKKCQGGGYVLKKIHRLYKYKEGQSRV